MPLIAASSRLRHFPAALNHRQAQRLNDIVVTVQGIDAAYARLRDALWNRTDDRGDLLVVVDAWMFVDWCDRLRRLIPGTPGLRRTSPARAALLQVLATVEPFRHDLQHIDQTAAAHPNRTPWGHIGWVAQPTPDRRLPEGSPPDEGFGLVARLGMLNVGVPTEGSGGQRVETSFEGIRPPFCAILYAADGERSVTLTKVHHAVELFASQLAAAAEAALSDDSAGIIPLNL